jgi:hypothetical protein
MSQVRARQLAATPGFAQTSSDATKQPTQSLSHSDATKQAAQSLSHSDPVTGDSLMKQH